jgi:GGDEF domain-containing protein
MLCPRADGARTVPARCGERVRVQVPEPRRAPADHCDDGGEDAHRDGRRARAARPGPAVPGRNGLRRPVGCRTAELTDAEAIVDRLQAHTPDGQTCSIGLAAWDGRESAGALVAAADDALYRAKLLGRDCISARLAL